VGGGRAAQDAGQTKLGADHPNGLTSIENLASTSEFTGQCSEAIDLLEFLLPSSNEF
jgi:hypothetical protein